MAKLYDGLSSTVARSLATSDPAVTVRLDDAAPPAADTVFIADGAGAGTWGAPPAGELPEILQAIALADPPTTAGQAPTYDGTGITWAAPSGGGSSLTGNPFLDPWGTPDAADDDFASGSDDFAERGWEVWNITDGVLMTRDGAITPWGLSFSGDTTKYRSSRSGTFMALQFPSGKTIALMRNVTAQSTEALYVRVGVPWGRALSSANSADTIIKGSAEVMLVRSQAAPGANPNSTLRHFMLLGTTRYLYTDGTITTSKNVNADSFTPANLSQVDGLCVMVNGSTMQKLSAITCASGTVRLAYEQGFGGEAFVTGNKVGLFLTSAELFAPTQTFMLDYFRRRPSWDWYGLAA